MWAPRARIGRTAFAAALRAARDDEDEIACIVCFLRGRGRNKKESKVVLNERETKLQLKTFGQGKNSRDV